MQDFEIHFKFFGKNFRTTIKAISRHEAQEKVRKLVPEKIEFYKPNPKNKINTDENVDFLKNFFGFN